MDVWIAGLNFWKCFLLPQLGYTCIHHLFRYAAKFYICIHSPSAHSFRFTFPLVHLRLPLKNTPAKNISLFVIRGWHNFTIPQYGCVAHNSPICHQNRPVNVFMALEVDRKYHTMLLRVICISINIFNFCDRTFRHFGIIYIVDIIYATLNEGFYVRAYDYILIVSFFVSGECRKWSPCTFNVVVSLS